MCEILFRGKRVDNGEWVYGDLRHDYDGVPCAISDCCGVNHIIPETVGQYTGLTDKNGKMIFEGDIIAGAVHWLERMKNGVVAFRCGSFGLIWHRGDVEQFNPFTSMCNVEYEVIGTIHDNSELIGGGENA